MDRPFHDALSDARRASHYPRMCDFTQVIGVPIRTYRNYESGKRIPKAPVLEQIIRRCSFSEAIADELRRLLSVETVKKFGITLRRLPPNLDVSVLAGKIQREIEYELKRAHLTLTSRTRQVCVRRIEMILKDSLEIP